MVTTDSGTPVLPVLFVSLDGTARWLPMTGPASGLPTALWMPERPDDEPAVPMLYQLHMSVFGDKRFPVYVSNQIHRDHVLRVILRAMFTTEAFEAWEAAEPAPRGAHDAD